MKFSDNLSSTMALSTFGFFSRKKTKSLIQHHVPKSEYSEHTLWGHIDTVLVNLRSQKGEGTYIEYKKDVRG
jgi:hypothetical protein